MTLAILGMPGGWEWIIILVIGLLLFGRRLPEIGRSVGKSIVEFKKGIKGIEDEVDGAVTSNSTKYAGNEKPALAPQGSDPRRVSTADKVEETTA